MSDGPVPYYNPPEIVCGYAPLKPNVAPLGACVCRICEWALLRREIEKGPVKPGTAAWDALLARANASDGG